MQRTMTVKAARSADISLRSEMRGYHEMRARNHLRVYFPRLVHAAEGITDLDELPSEVSEWVGPGHECDVIVVSDEGPSVLSWLCSPEVQQYSPEHRMDDLMVLMMRGLKTIGELREFGVAHQETLCKNVSIYGVLLMLDAVVMCDNVERAGPWHPERGIFPTYDKTRDGVDAFTFVESVWRLGPDWVRDPDGDFARARLQSFNDRVLSESAIAHRGEFPCFLHPFEYTDISWTTWKVYTIFDRILMNE